MKVFEVFVPLPRDLLYSALTSGAEQKVGEITQADGRMEQKPDDVCGVAQNR
jgi:hypothetical protein